MINLLFCISLLWGIAGQAKTENIEFIALYNAIMDGSFDPNAGGRMATTANTQRVANNPQSENKTLAETALALFRDAEYVRYGVPINRKTNLSSSLQHSFTIVPNPAQDVVNIVLLNEKTEATNFVIYDLNGKVVATIPVSKGTQQLSLNISHLPSGMYYCRLANSIGVEKLVIIGK